MDWMSQRLARIKGLVLLQKLSAWGASFGVLMVAILGGLAPSEAQAAIKLMCVSDSAAKLGLEPSQTTVVTLYRELIFPVPSLQNRKTVFSVHERGELKEKLILSSVQVPPSQRDAVVEQYVGFTHLGRLDLRVEQPMDSDHWTRYPFRLRMTRKTPTQRFYSSWVCRHSFN